MITYRKANDLLSPGDVVYTTINGGVIPAVVLEICDGWLETEIGILDFEDHSCTWWLTKKVAEDKL